MNKELIHIVVVSPNPAMPTEQLWPTEIIAPTAIPRLTELPSYDENLDTGMSYWCGPDAQE